MKLTLMIEGTASAIAAVLASLPDGGVTQTLTVTSADDDDNDGPDVAPTGALDADGLPWDERIHASTKTLTVRGLWKKRKGADAETIKAVEASLRAGMGQTPTPLVPTEPVGMPAMPVMTPQTPAVVPMTMPEPAQQTMMPIGMPTNAVPPVPAGPTFAEFMQKVSDLMMANPPKLTNDNVVWLCGQIGVQALTDLDQKPDRIPAAIDELRKYQLWAD